MSTHPFWTPQGIARATGGRLVAADAADAAQPLAGLSTDTRSIAPGQAFLALAGDNFDAHDFLEHAVKAGSALLVVSDAARVPDGTAAVIVDDTLTALQQLAAAWRDVLAEHGTKVIAITGSNGKTTTRTIVHGVLSSQAAGLSGTQSPKSFNNHIGVPLTLLGASIDDDFVVAEMGMNHAGEIAVLAEIARPDAAAVTHLGRAHIGLLGSREAIAREKGSIFAHVAADGLAVLPSRANWPGDTMPTPAAENTVHFAGDDDEEADLFVGQNDEAAEIQNGVQHFVARTRLTDGSVSDLPLALPLAGPHNAVNTLIAVAVARWMGIDDRAIAEAVRGLTGAPMRLERRSIGSGGPADRIDLINDCYNANPDSMQAALAYLARCTPPGPTGRRIAVLGDMFELGDLAPAEHRALADSVRAAGEAKGAQPIDVAVFIGELTMFSGEALRRHWDDARVAVMGSWDDTTPRRVAALIRPGDVVLLKASRGMALERLIPALEQSLPAKP